MVTTIQVKRREVYGNSLIYPCNYQEELRCLTGKKTLDSADLEALKALGFEIYDCDQIIKDLINS